MEVKETGQRQSISIGKASANDIPAITELYVQLGTEEKLSADEALCILNKFAQYPNYWLYVVKLNDEVVGAFELLIMDNFAHKGAPTGIIEDVVVDVRFRSQGIGKVMMQYAMEVYRQYKCMKLSLSSNLNREKAHRFYESLGFVKHGYSFYISL